MKIFGELVKRYWNGKLQDPGDLSNLAEEIRERYGFSNEDMSFIKDHIRIAMGLDPKGDEEFRDELDIVLSSKEVREPIIAKIQGACEHCGYTSCKCEDVCKYEAHIYKRSDEPVIAGSKCLSCGECIAACDFGALADKIEFLPLIDLLKDEGTPVYASVAPAIAGQFGDAVSMGQLRTALKLLGFRDMIETALFADILTIREAFEFMHLVKHAGDFFLKLLLPHMVQFDKEALSWYFHAHVTIGIPYDCIRQVPEKAVQRRKGGFHCPLYCKKG